MILSLSKFKKKFKYWSFFVQINYEIEQQQKKKALDKAFHPCRIYITVFKVKLFNMS